jgi:hypothetical protein
MRHVLALILAALGPAPAVAEVAAVSETGFVSHNEAVVLAPPAEVWDWMLKPSVWWDSAHTYSGSAANLTLAPLAGGCFCESIPAANGVPAGQVEHMRVVYVDPRVHTLRLSGGLGPLQSEALTGVLTMTLEQTGDGTKISWDYVVGGYSRTPMADLASPVDRVIGEQLSMLALIIKSAHVPLEVTHDRHPRGF